MRVPLRNRRRSELHVDMLESRTLLSAGSPKAPLLASDATPLQPLSISARIGPRFDRNGNGVALQQAVKIVGQTQPGVEVRLSLDSWGNAFRTTRADARGNYSAVLRLPVGLAELNVACVDRSGEVASTSLTITRGDVVIDWNVTALNAIRTAKSNPPLAARNLAVMHLAVFSAVNAFDPRYAAYEGIQARAPRGGSMSAAAAGAAHEVLSRLYPALAATFDATLAECLATIPNVAGRNRGEAFGRQVAESILALRAGDGSDAFVDAPPATQPGMWAPTPPAFGKPVGLNFAFVTPFAINSPSQFRPAPPPSLESAEYAAAYNEVKSVGVLDSTTRTADQTAYSHFWADLPGRTFTPPGHWNQIAQHAAMSQRLGLRAEARLFALLNIALADAGISCWETKNYYDFWRPVTAIRQGDTDANDQTESDPTWTPQWDSPAFSSYTSGHATFSAAAATVLEAAFGADFAFWDTGDPRERLEPRRFTSFRQAAVEAADSRMYGGIHFRFDNETGLEAGTEIGQYVLQNALLPLRGRPR